MKTLTIDGIYVTASEELTEEELKQYVTNLREHYLLAKSMRFELDGISPIFTMMIFFFTPIIFAAMPTQ